MDAVAAMQPGWNLGNTLDAIPDETSWGFCVKFSVLN
jgi:endoglucanase